MRAGAVAPLDALPGLPEFEARLARGDFPRGQVRVLQGEDVLAGDALGPGPGVDPALCRDRLAAGATVSVDHYDRLHAGVWALGQDFARALGAPNCSNAYYTPAGHPGLDPHFDTQEVFVLQIGGAKAWEVYPAPVALPRVGGHGRTADVSDQPVLVEAVLRPGDLLHVPRGFAHRARALPDAPSLHLTLTVAAFEWADVLHALVDRAAGRDVRLRQAVGVDWRAPHRNRPEDDAAVQQVLATLLQAGDLDAVMDGLAAKLRRLHGLSAPPDGSAAP